MRTIDHTKFTLTYPDEVCYDKDYNYYELKLKDTTKAAYLKLDFGDGHILEYSSSGYLVRIYVTEALKAFSTYNNLLSITHTVKENGVIVNSGSTSLRLEQGVTLADRTHNSEKVIYIVEGESRVYFSLRSQPTTVTLDGNDFSFNQTGVRWLGVTSSSSNLSFLTQVQGHDIYGTDYSTVKIEWMCIPQGGLVVKYRNIDGCERVVAAYLIDKSEVGKGTEYGIRTPKRYTNEFQQTITLGWSDINKGGRITDIIYCDSVEIYSADGSYHVTAIPTTTNVTTNPNDTNDITITFKILR